MSKGNSPKSTHGGYGGRTIIERIEIQMDKRRKEMERIFIEVGPVVVEGIEFEPKELTLNRGRYEGYAASLALLRSSSVQQEISRSNERLGIE